MVKTSLIIPFIDQPDITRRCLEVVNQNSDPDGFEVVLIDNGSADPNMLNYEEILSRVDWKLVRNDENIGVLRTFQQGLNESSGEVLIFIHNDVLIHGEGWNRHVADEFKTNPKLGIAGFLGARGCAPDGGRWGTMSNMLGREWGKCGDCADVHPIAAIHHGEHIQGTAPAAVLDGLCMMFRREAFEQVAKNTNIFDEDRAPHHWYDRNISLNFIYQGWQMAVIGIPFDHFSGATANSSTTYYETATKWLEEHGQADLLETLPPDQAVYEVGRRQFDEEWAPRLLVSVTPDWQYFWGQR